MMHLVGLVRARTCHTCVSTFLIGSLPQCFKNSWCAPDQIGIVDIYQPTLDLKLDVLKLAKLTSHSAPLYNPTIAQKDQDYVLARSVSTGPPWTDAEWKSWCNRLSRGDSIKKANLPLHNRRGAQQKSVRNWVLKKPAANQRPKRAMKMHRTPFTLVKKSVLKRTGVKGR